MKRVFLTFLAIFLLLGLSVPAQAERFVWADAYDFYVTHELKLKAAADLELGAGVTFSGSGWALTRSFELPLASAIVQGDQDTPISADGTTDPGIAVNDLLSSIVWSSPEETPVQWTFRLPSDYSGSLSFRVLVSASSNGQTYDWELLVNKDDTVFDAAAFAQAAVAQTGTHPTTENEIITLTPDSTALADLAAGNSVTINLWRSNVAAGNAEVKGVTVLYSATR